MKMEYARLCDLYAFFDRYFPKRTHDGNDIDCHRTGGGAGIASHAQPDIRTREHF
jgi:hypothetical protein